MAEKELIPKEQYLTEFACPKCQKHITWAMEQATVVCPFCTRKVNIKTMKNPNPAKLPMESDQLVLFS